LEAAIGFLSATGRTTIAVANFKGYRSFPHFDSRHRYPIALLEKHGFERLRELVDVSRSLEGYETPPWAVEAKEQLRDQGIGFDYCHPAYRSRFLAFIEAHFWERWIDHNRRYVEQGGDPRERILTLLDDEVVGFVNFAVTGARGQIRQTGVLPALRGKRIGSVLVFKAMADMVSSGATELSIAWCPWGLYKITEGQITRSRVHLGKALTPTE
jgi:hypothetical protein